MNPAPPGRFGRLTRSAIEQIDGACDHFEAAWTRGDSPRIEDVLLCVDAASRPALLRELIVLELAYRGKQGERLPRREEYVRRFPTQAAVVDDAFREGKGEETRPPRGTAKTGENLLFGILALHNSFIDRAGLLAAFNAWVEDKSRSLGQILVAQGALTPARLMLLEALVAEHISQHDGDAEQSLATVDTLGSVRRDLEDIADSELQATLPRVSAVCGASDKNARSAGTPGRTGERYRILRFHAKGGLGEVYVASDDELHREVALKRIQDPFAQDEGSRSRFVMEAEITGGLEHPGIVPVYGLGHYDNGRPFYAMRLIKGDSLKEAIDQFHQSESPDRDPGGRVLALQKLLRRFLDVCNAIEYAHSRGVLHRDLKPGNVMVGKYGETLVVDWGLAKSVTRTSGNDPLPEVTLRPSSTSGSAETMPGSVVGTPAYMSPEQAAGRLDQLGPASDVYSLGATLYALLTNKAPFADRDVNRVLQQVQQGDFPKPRDRVRWLDPALEAVCLKAMSREPEDRYKSPRALAGDIERWLADEPVSAYREPWRRRARRWTMRNRSAVAALAAVVLVSSFLGGGGYAWEEHRRSGRAARTARGVEVALARAERLRGEAQVAPAGELAKWEAAMAAAGEAEGLIHQGEADLPLRGRVDRLRIVLKHEQLEAEERARQAAIDQKMLAELETVRGTRWEAWQPKQTDADYAAAFRKYGLDLDKTAPKPAGAWIANRTEPVHLGSYLDDWAFVRQQAGGDEKSWRHLIETARTADPDPWRDALRSRMGRKDPDAIAEFRRLADSESALNGRTVASLILLALSLKNEANDLDRARRVLRLAWRQEPRDYFVNFELAVVERKSGGAYLNNFDAARHLTAAIAARPSSIAAHNSLGIALWSQGQLEAAVEEYRTALRIKPDYAEAHTNLGIILQAQGHLEAALEEYRTALRIKPDLIEAYHNFGSALQTQGQLEAAIEKYRAALRINPDFFQSHVNLGSVLKIQGHLEAAAGEFRAAVRIKPDDPQIHHDLGMVLWTQGDLEAAAEEYRAALRIDPNYAIAHSNFGLVLHAQRNIEAALEEYRTALRIKPDLVEAHNNFGWALQAQGHLEAAVEKYRAALRINPDFFPSHVNLGSVLKIQGHLEAAAEEFRTILRIKPDDANAHYNLGLVLQTQGHLEAAADEFRASVRIKPDDPQTHHDLGIVLWTQGHLEAAAEEYQAALRIDPERGFSHWNRGISLRDIGRFDEALVELRRGHELGSKQPDWPSDAEANIHLCEQLASLAGRLSAILKGDDRPKNPAEGLIFGELCYDKAFYATATRFWDEAITADPKLAEDRQNPPRYNAACSAALACSGKSRNEPLPEDSARKKLHEQALGWLKAELAAWSKVHDTGTTRDREAVRQNLAHWKVDADLAGLRDEPGLARLPEEERKVWQAFWAEVDVLLKKAGSTSP